MNKVDFSDVNKFLASLGIGIIVVSLLLPWYVRSSSEVILISQSEISGLTPEAKSAVQGQQGYLAFMSQYLLGIMGLLICIGCTLIYCALRKWRGRQLVLDSIQDEELRIKKQEGVSQREKVDSIQEEIKGYNQDMDSQVEKHIEVEDEIYFKLAKHFTVNYKVEQNIRLGRFQYDILFQSRFISKRVDWVIEIKYREEKVKLEFMKRAFRQLFKSGINYQNSLGRPMPLLALIIVVSNDANLPSPSDLDSIRILASNDVEKFRLNAITKSDIESLPANELLHGKK